MQKRLQEEFTDRKITVFNIGIEGYELMRAIPFAELEQVKLSLNIGLRDKVFMKETGLENRASIILAIGAENVGK